MSDSSANNFEGLLAGAGAPAQDSGQGVTPPTPAAPPQPPEPQFSDYAKSLLGEVDEAERAVVEKYVSKWDAGVERRVRELESVYGPIDDILTGRNMGPEDLQQAAEFYHLLNTAPTKVLEALNNAYGDKTQGQQPVGGAGQQQQGVQLPPEVQKQLNDMNTAMQQVAMTQQQSQTAMQQAAEDRALDEMLTMLHQEKGEFDNNYVLSQIAMGVPADKAVDDFHAMIQKHGGGNQGPNLPAPPVLNGGSAIGAGSTPVHALSTNDRKALVQQILTHANQQGN